jgi:hypothetical protein
MALVVLRKYAMLTEAHAAAAALRSAGLYPVLLDEIIAPPYGGMTSMGGFRLAVTDEEATEAAEVLQAALAAPTPEGEAASYDAWWEEEAERQAPVMPVAQRAGRVFVGLYLTWFAALMLVAIVGLAAAFLNR